jgi:1,4-dihydroxy-2-naphthoate octaprenyltransferase
VTELPDAFGMLRRVWIPAARPRTLPAAVAPVVMGTAVAWGEGAFHAAAAAAALLGAVLIQVGTNYANDYFDHVKGVDTEARLGPRRATASGQVSPRAMRRACLLAFGLAALVGLYLVWRAGWPLVAVGLASILLGVLYTGGPRPLGYVGLADLPVLLFFGPVATAGTHYVQALEFSGPAAWAGLGPGLLSVALLTVNNLRDVESDRATGKRTLAVRFGPRFAQVQYALCLLGAVAVPFVLWIALDAPANVLLASAGCLLGLSGLRSVLRWRPGDRLGAALAGTGRLLAVYALLFAIGWLL